VDARRAEERAPASRPPSRLTGIRDSVDSSAMSLLSR